MIDSDFYGLFTLLDGAYGDVLDNIAMWQCINSLGIKPYKDGNKWCYLFGENIQEGICGFGDSIYDAAYNFYNEIKSYSLINEGRNEL